MLHSNAVIRIVSRFIKNEPATLLGVPFRASKLFAGRLVFPELPRFELFTIIITNVLFMQNRFSRLINNKPNDNKILKPIQSWQNLYSNE